jgi:GNAT superfamily N-acetyltransferase
MLKNKIFKHQTGGNVNVAPKPIYKPSIKLDNNRVVIPDIYNTRVGDLLPSQLEHQVGIAPRMNLKDAELFRKNQRELNDIMNRPASFMEKFNRVPGETWEDLKSLLPDMPSRTNISPKGYKDLKEFQKSGTIGKSLKSWTATDNASVSRVMNQPYKGEAYQPRTSSIRATTDADKANAAYQHREREYWEYKSSGQLATWADKKLQNWDYNMGSVPGESLLATPMRLLSNIGHSANRYSKAVENTEDRGSNLLKGFGNQTLASLDGLMLADGLSAAGSKLSTDAIVDATKNTYRLNPLANKQAGPTRLTLGDRYIIDRRVESPTLNEIHLMDNNTGQRVGYANTSSFHGTPELGYINVDGSLRGKGLSKVLYNEAISMAKSQGHEGILAGKALMSPEASIPSYKHFTTNPLPTFERTKAVAKSEGVLLNKTNLEQVNNIMSSQLRAGTEQSPHWLRGYRKLDANGNPINVNYKLMRDKDKMMSGPIPTFSWKPYESSADDIISGQNMDTRLQSMYDKANKQRIDDLINDRPYDPDFNEASFLKELSNAMQIHRMEVAPGRSLFTLNPEGAMFSTEGGTMRNLEDIMEALRKDHINNSVK